MRRPLSKEENESIPRMIVTAPRTRKPRARKTSRRSRCPLISSPTTKFANVTSHEQKKGAYPCPQELATSLSHGTSARPFERSSRTNAAGPMATLDGRISTIVGSWRWPAIPTVNFTCAGHSSPRVNSEHTNCQSAMPLDIYCAELPVTDFAHHARPLGSMFR